MIIQELIPRVLRDIEDGVLVTDLHGCIIYTNPQIERMLGLRPENIGQTYAQVFLLENAQENDAFHQSILDAIYCKQQAHSHTVPFHDASGSKRFLKVTSSFLKSENGDEHSGIVLVVSDETQAELMKRKRDNASVVFASLAACICLYLLLISGLEYFKIDVFSKVLTQITNGMVFVTAFVIYRKTDFSRDELGLKLVNPRFTLLSSLAFCAVVIAAMIAAKLIMLQTVPEFFGENTPFWRWDLGIYSWLFYIVTCFSQEFVAWVVLYGSIHKMFEGKHSVMISIILSALMFGAVHVVHGFIMMLGSILLLSVLGIFYEKHQNVWGVTIIHYIIAQAAFCLSFVV